MVIFIIRFSFHHEDSDARFSTINIFPGEKIKMRILNYLRQEGLSYKLQMVALN